MGAFGGLGMMDWDGGWYWELKYSSGHSGIMLLC